MLPLDSFVGSSGTGSQWGTSHTSVGGVSALEGQTEASASQTEETQEGYEEGITVEEGGEQS